MAVYGVKGKDLKGMEKLSQGGRWGERRGGKDSRERGQEEEEKGKREQESGK